MNLRRSLFTFTLVVFVTFGILVLLVFNRYITNAYDYYEVRAKNLILVNLRSEIREDISSLKMLGDMLAYNLTLNGNIEKELTNPNFFLRDEILENNRYNFIAVTDLNGEIRYSQSFINGVPRTAPITPISDDKNDQMIVIPYVDFNRIISTTLGFKNNFNTSGIIWSEVRNRFYFIDVSPIQYNKNKYNYIPQGYLFLGREISSNEIVSNITINDNVVWKISKIKQSDLPTGMDNTINTKPDGSDTFFVLDDIYGQNIIKIEIFSWSNDVKYKREESTIIISIIILLYAIIIISSTFTVINNFYNKIMIIMNEMDAIEESKYIKQKINYMNPNDELYDIVQKINRLIHTAILVSPGISSTYEKHSKEDIDDIENFKNKE